MEIDIVDLLEQVATTLQNTGKANDLTVEAARAGAAELRELRNLGRRVVDARYYHGDDGWDRLRNAICDLEGKVGRS